jgi:hypothetical protein
VDKGLGRSLETQGMDQALNSMYVPMRIIQVMIQDSAGVIIPKGYGQVNQAKV